MSDDLMTEAQRLELAGYIAPALRRVKAEAMQRRVTIVHKDGSTKPGVLGDALKGLAKIHELEHAVAEGQRPKVVVCQDCGRTVSVNFNGVVPSRCKEGVGCRTSADVLPCRWCGHAQESANRGGGTALLCKACESTPCPCGNRVGIATVRRRAADGKPLMCRPCSAKISGARGLGAAAMKAKAAGRSAEEMVARTALTREKNRKRMRDWYRSLSVEDRKAYQANLQAARRSRDAAKEKA